MVAKAGPVRVRMGEHSDPGTRAPGGERVPDHWCATGHGDSTLEDVRKGCHPRWPTSEIGSLLGRFHASTMGDPRCSSTSVMDIPELRSMAMSP